MSTVLDKLPGIPLAVPELTGALARMWESDESEGTPLADTHAMQMNLVLHLGPETRPEEAQRCFDTCIQFAQRYPCRIVTICRQGPGEDGLRARLFSQCYIGPSFRETCCCDAVIVADDGSDPHFLANQVPLWLEPDLPTYYWLHRVAVDEIKERAMPLLQRCMRIVYDHSIEGTAYQRVKFPRPQRVKDLSLARTLAIRQALGQHLSAESPTALATGLKRVRTRHSAAFLGEAGNLSCWQEYCLMLCRRQIGEPEKTDAPFEVSALPPDSPHSLEIDWEYADEAKQFRWTLDAETGCSHFEGDFGEGHRSLPMQIGLMPPAKALAEAMFFTDWTS